MESTLLDQGVELMLYGMGTVFVFLAILVLVTTSMSAFVQRFLPQPEPPAPAATAAPGVSAQANDSLHDETLIAVISAAIQKHRSRHK